ncbi:MAG: serine/threonine-protein kinase, partial [Myxococcota bacterium]
MFSIPLGPFDLQSPIGKGGMGEVWRGFHRVQQVPVAIKVMTGARARHRRYREAFLNEVRAVATLNHPGVVMIFDYGTVTSEAEERSSRRLVARSPYLVMELASRGSLDQIRGIIPWSDLKRFLISLLDALAHAHARGVIHRDLKPGNVLVCADSDLRPGLKLTDFGLAHAQDETGPGVTQERAGTPRYMAPELFEGNWRDYGPWTDLYALGCMAYEMCANRPMFDGQDFQSLKRQHLYEPPPALKARQPVPDEFESWLSRLVQKKPQDRFQYAADAAWALMRMDLDSASPNFYWTMDMPRVGQGEQTNLMTNMSGLGEVSTFFFPDLPWSMGSSTMIHADHNNVYQAATHMLRDRPVQDASTYLFPDHELAQSPTFLYPGSLSRYQRQRRPQNIAPITESASEPMGVEPAPMPPTWKHAEAGPPSMQLVGVGLRLFELRTVRMVGREQERDTVWSLLAEVRQSGRAQLALLHGPAGVGKSRMAQRISERALEVGAATVLRATHDPMSGPTEGLSRMVARHLGALGMRRPEIRRRTRKLLQGRGVTDPYEWDALTEMISSNLEHTSMVRAKPIQFAGPVERYVLVRRLLERVGRERPAIVWLDDVQWGSDSIAFAEYLMKGQAVSPTPVLILLTARDETLAERPIEHEMLDALMRLSHTHDVPVEADR